MAAAALPRLYLLSLVLSPTCISLPQQGQPSWRAPPYQKAEEKQKQTAETTTPAPSLTLRPGGGRLRRPLPLSISGGGPWPLLCCKMTLSYLFPIRDIVYLDYAIMR